MLHKILKIFTRKTPDASREAALLDELFATDLSEEMLSRPENHARYMAKNMGWIAVSYESPDAADTAQTAESSEVPKAKERYNFFSWKAQLRSLGFGLLCGGLVMGAFWFTVFNQLIITPFIHPSSAVVKAPVLDDKGEPADPASKIRIPKISVEIPLVYGVKSSSEKQIELALDKGVVHYPTTVLPGQQGNTAFFGHSSNNIFNPGKYKFAFILLHELVPKDMFYLTSKGKIYTYEVISRNVVKPSEVGVLGPVPGQVATATLITCDPPGTSNNRLVVVGKQVSPDPNGNKRPAAPIPAEANQDAKILPGNGPGPLTRLWRSFLSHF